MFRLVIEAMAHEGAANMSVAIDDISIEACDQGKRCSVNGYIFSDIELCNRPGINDKIKHM